MGGMNTYGYADAAPSSRIDPMGLATIVGAPPYGPNFGRPSNEYRQWQEKYGRPLQNMLDAIERRISTLCPADRAAIQKEFDEWIVRVDPNIENMAKRARTGYATTRGNTSTFNKPFFDITGYESPSQYAVGLHELRHTMPSNAAIVDPPGSMGDILAGRADRVPSEIDADRFADWFLKSSNKCGCPK